MKKHVYILHFYYMTDNWSSIIHSRLNKIPEDYLKELCEDILEDVRVDWFNKSISNCKLDENRVNHIKDISINNYKSYSFEYLGYMNVHILDYNIITIKQDEQKIGTRLNEAYKRGIS